MLSGRLRHAGSALHSGKLFTFPINPWPGCQKQLEKSREYQGALRG
jgi:hypothetical protein